MGTTIRPAVPADAEVISEKVHALATFEEEPDAVVATPASIRAQLEMDNPPFNCLVLLDDQNEARGVAIFFYNYSTWTGVPGLYLEDIFIDDECRGLGYGKLLMGALAEIAVEKGCARMEWVVIDWNVNAIAFYEGLGAEVKRDWLPCRIEGDALRNLALATKG